jgi:hypothetical protein
MMPVGQYQMFSFVASQMLSAVMTAAMISILLSGSPSARFPQSTF